MCFFLRGSHRPTQLIKTSPKPKPAIWWSKANGSYLKTVWYGWKKIRMSIPDRVMFPSTAKTTTYCTAAVSITGRPRFLRMLRDRFTMKFLLLICTETKYINMFTPVRRRSIIRWTRIKSMCPTKRIHMWKRRAILKNWENYSPEKSMYPMLSELM
jgi:hypothetical protein